MRTLISHSLFLLAILLVCGCSGNAGAEGTTNSTDMAVQDDSGVVLDADTEADQSIDNSPEGTDVEQDTKVCPTAKRPQATIEVNYQGQIICLDSFEKEAFELLAASKGVPLYSCAQFGDSDYCLSEFTVGPPSTEEGCFDFTITYPEEPGVKYTGTFQKCDSSTKVCGFEEVVDGETTNVTYDVSAKTLVKVWHDSIGSDTEAYKLVPKN